MTCNEFEEILPDYMQDPTDPRHRGTVEKHMADCAECRESYAIWSKLVTLPDVEPSPAMRSRFDAMLNAYEEGRWEHDKL
jgi:anti-sigma factor RsiW